MQWCVYQEAHNPKWKKAPDFHWEIIDFLDDYKNWKNNTAVLQVFRGAAKSTILGVFIVYLLVKDPTLSILVLSADNETAKKIVADCASIIQKHPAAKHLYSRHLTKTKQKFFVRGSTDHRNPSVIAFGIASQVTSARADIIIGDDIEVPKNASTAEAREQIRTRMEEATHILVPGGKKLLVGTPHAFESIYPEAISAGASAKTIPLFIEYTGEWPNMVGKSRWPDRFDDAEIALRQKAVRTKGGFMSQYMLLPYRVDQTRLDASALKLYDDALKIKKANGVTTAWIGDKQMYSYTAWWDPSLSKDKSDDSVLAVVYTSADGDFYVHRVAALYGGLEQQCLQVVAILNELSLPHVCVETNGVGGFVPQILRNYTNPLGVGVEEVHTTKNKQIKIVESFEGPLSVGCIYAHRSVAEGKLITQLRDFSPRNTNDPDDWIDAVASAIDREPTRVSRVVLAERGDGFDWVTTGQVYDIPHEFTLN